MNNELTVKRIEKEAKNTKHLVDEISEYLDERFNMGGLDKEYLDETAKTIVKFLLDWRKK